VRQREMLDRSKKTEYSWRNESNLLSSKRTSYCSGSSKERKEKMK
jgi:hypothetical protein